MAMQIKVPSIALGESQRALVWADANYFQEEGACACHCCAEHCIDDTTQAEVIGRFSEESHVCK